MYFVRKLHNLHVSSWWHAHVAEKQGLIESQDGKIETHQPRLDVFRLTPDSPYSNKWAAFEVLKSSASLIRFPVELFGSRSWEDGLFLPYVVWNMIGWSPVCIPIPTWFLAPSIRGINVSPRLQRPTRGKRATAEFWPHTERGLLRIWGLGLESRIWDL